MNIAIVQYDTGNTCSVSFALQRLGIISVITDDAARIQGADKVILPGVGAAGNAMQYLREKKLDRVIASLQQPVLGICLGMQLLCRFSEEDNTHCLDIFPQTVQRFRGSKKIPHMGWNSINAMQGPLFRDIEEQAHMYFVHSYYAPLNKYTIAACSYPDGFSAAIQKNNFYGVQFHPEKSGATGSQLLQNFLAI